jgi:molecular chaperone HscB
MTSETSAGATGAATGRPLRIDADDFALFTLKPAFAQDRAVLDARWKALQAEVHPDRFASEGAAAQRVAMQWAIRVNEAYQRLKDPLKRAAYLCELNGQAIGAENNTAMPAAFLMQQMEWREALDEARSLAQVEALAEQVAARQRALHAELAVLIDQHQDWPAATAQVRVLMFITRFAQDVDRRLDALGA